jgi:hypothetical protein
MNYKDIRTLKMLEAVENDGKTSQRALAEHLDISLGLANTCFRRLATAGYFKPCSTIKSDVRYELTRKGAREKARLTYEYILLSYSLFKDAQDKLTDFFTELGNKRIRRLVFWGVNDFAEMAYLSMQRTSLEMVAVVDEGKIGQCFFGMPIGNISVLGTLSFDKLLITDPKIDCDSFSHEIFPEKFFHRVISAPFYGV